MMIFCCHEFKEHAQRKQHEAGAFIQDERGRWTIVADGGANAVNPMKFCPFCGTKMGVVR